MNNGVHDIGGSRDDPHRQARDARERSPLLHSMSAFRELFEQIFAHRPVTKVVEVGVESGQVSAVYADLGATVYCVEPHPDERLRGFITEHPALNLVEKASPGALDEAPAADLYVLDGDHNYAVVRRELAWIMKNAPDAVVVLHDVLWPCGRRDFYYQPSPLPPSDVHPSTGDGPTVWHDDVTPAGFVGDGVLTVATHAGGERNGVLTAVEDANRLAETIAEQRQEIQRSRAELERSGAEIATRQSELQRLRAELARLSAARPAVSPGLNTAMTRVGRAFSARVRRSPDL